MQNIFIYANSCTRRLLDAKRIQTYFIKNGYHIISNPKKADIIIFIACDFHGNIAEQNFKIIKKFQNYKAELIVAGCLPINDKENLLKYFNGRTLGTKELNRDDSKIDQLFPNNKIKFVNIKDENIIYYNKNRFYPIKLFFRKIKFLEKGYVNIFDYIYKHIYGKNSLMYVNFPKKPLFHIRIAHGCNAKCTYCVIRKSTGRFHSKPYDQCIKEFKKGLSLGYKNFIITAENIGCYGIDNNSSFPELLNELTKINGDFKLIIKGLEPNWLIKYIDIIEEIIKRDKIKLLGIPMQSGSPKILKLMNRNIDLEKLKDAYHRLKKANPNLMIDTDFIIGYPTETDEDFHKTLELIKDIDTTFAFFFLYSNRSGTISEKLQPQITEKQKQFRIRIAKIFLKDIGYKTRYTLQKQIPFFEKKQRSEV